MHLVAQTFPYEAGQATVGWLGLKLMKMTIWTLLKLFSLIYYTTDKQALKKMHEFTQEISILLEGVSVAPVLSSASQSHPWTLPVHITHLR